MVAAEQSSGTLHKQLNWFIEILAISTFYVIEVLDPITIIQRGE
jgi:hypothetical protein